MAMAHNGISFRTVVTLCTHPEALMPYQLTSVRLHNTTIVTVAEVTGEAPTWGNSGVR